MKKKSLQNFYVLLLFIDLCNINNNYFYSDIIFVNTESTALILFDQRLWKILWESFESI